MDVSGLKHGLFHRCLIAWMCMWWQLSADVPHFRVIYPVFASTPTSDRIAANDSLTVSATDLYI